MLPLGFYGIRPHGYRRRRIVECLRLDTLGSVFSLLWTVSLVKKDYQSFLTSLPGPSPWLETARGRRFKIYHSNQKTKGELIAPLWFFGRSDGIRTHGLLVPNQAHYQTVPHPDISDLDSISQMFGFVKRLERFRLLKI